MKKLDELERKLYRKLKHRHWEAPKLRKTKLERKAHRYEYLLYIKLRNRHEERIRAMLAKNTWAYDVTDVPFDKRQRVKDTFDISAPPVEEVGLRNHPEWLI